MKVKITKLDNGKAKVQFMLKNIMITSLKQRRNKKHTLLQ